jgi:hypothetical protein
LLGYASGLLAVGELIAEISDERRHVGIPATCLVQARAAVPDGFGAAQLVLLTTSPTVVVPPQVATWPPGTPSTRRWRTAPPTGAPNRRARPASCPPDGASSTSARSSLG